MPYIHQFHTSTSNVQAKPTATAAQRVKRRTAHAAAAIHAIRSAHQDELDAKRAAYALRMAYGRPQRRRYHGSSMPVATGQAHSEYGQPSPIAPALSPASSPCSLTSPHNDALDLKWTSTGVVEEPAPALTLDQLCGALPEVQRFQTPRTTRGIAMLGATLHTVQGQAVLLGLRWVQYSPGTPLPPESPAPGLWISVMHLLTGRQWSGKVPLASLQRCSDEFIQACLQWHAWGKVQHGFAQAVARHSPGAVLPGTQRYGRAAPLRRSALSHGPQYLEVSQPTTWLSAGKPSKIQPSPDDLHTSAGHVLHCSAALGAACVEIPSLDNLRALSVSQSEGLCTIAGAKGVMPQLEVSVAAYEQAGLLATRVRTSTAGGWKIELMFEVRPAIAQTERMPQALVAASQLRPLLHADGSKLMLRVAPAMRRRRRANERAAMPGPMPGKQVEAWQLKFRVVHLDPISLQISTKTIGLAQALKEKHLVTRLAILAHLSRRLVSYVTAAEAQLIERLVRNIVMPADSVPLGLVPLATRHAQATAAPPTRAASTAGTHMLVSRLGTRATGGTLKSATTYGSALSRQSALLHSAAPQRTVLAAGARLDVGPSTSVANPSTSHWRVISVASVSGVMSMEPEALPAQGRMTTAQRILNQLDLPATQQCAKLRGPHSAFPATASSGAASSTSPSNVLSNWPSMSNSPASADSAAEPVVSAVPSSAQPSSSAAPSPPHATSVTAEKEVAQAGSTLRLASQVEPATPARHPPAESPQPPAGPPHTQVTPSHAEASSIVERDLIAEEVDAALDSVHVAELKAIATPQRHAPLQPISPQLAQGTSAEPSPHFVASNSSEPAQLVDIIDVPTVLSSRTSVILELSEGEHDTLEGHSSPELSTQDNHLERQTISSAAVTMAAAAAVTTDESSELSSSSIAPTPAMDTGPSSPCTTELSAGVLLDAPGSPSLQTRRKLLRSQDLPDSKGDSSNGASPREYGLRDIAEESKVSWGGKTESLSGSGYMTPAAQSSDSVQPASAPDQDLHVEPALPAEPVSNTLVPDQQLISPHGNIDGKCSCELDYSEEVSVPRRGTPASPGPRHESSHRTAPVSDEEAAYNAQLGEAQRQGEAAAHEIIAQLREEAEQAAHQRVAQAHQVTHALSFIRDKLLDMDASDAASIDVSTSEDDMDIDYDIQTHLGTLHAH